MHRNIIIHTATFDLEAVLPIPCSLVSQTYYKRKLSSYNFTVYSLSDGKGTCFFWNETDGQQGSCGIAACLHLYLNSLSSCTEQFSDSCIGQNRNTFVASALLHAVCTSTYLKVVNHKFLEPGHKQMECDSMHSAMEYAKRKTNIYVFELIKSLHWASSDICPCQNVLSSHNTFWHKQNVFQY
jgi:hypothetical protein